MKPGVKRTSASSWFAAHAIQSEGCWIWSGKKTVLGYGQLRLDGEGHKYMYAHRYSYELYKGPIPAGLLIRHSCDNPSCVNPEHLSVGGKVENGQDMASRGRQSMQKRTHCKKGHELTPENFYIEKKSGVRRCAICYKETCRARTLRHAEGTRLRNIEYRKKKKAEKLVTAIA